MCDTQPWTRANCLATAPTTIAAGRNHGKLTSCPPVRDCLELGRSTRKAVERFGSATRRSRADKRRLACALLGEAKTQRSVSRARLLPGSRKDMQSSELLIFIPTYNEADNVERL